MSATDYAATIEVVRPGAAFVINGNDYSTLEWLDTSPKPTKKTLDDAWPDVELAESIKAVDEARQRRYIRETDPIFLEAWANANPGGQPDLTAWRAARAQVKLDLPKPTR
jgi:hypothetical protein